MAGVGSDIRVGAVEELAVTAMGSGPLGVCVIAGMLIVLVDGGYGMEDGEVRWVSRGCSEDKVQKLVVVELVDEGREISRMKRAGRAERKKERAGMRT